MDNEQLVATVTKIVIERLAHPASGVPHHRIGTPGVVDLSGRKVVGERDVRDLGSGVVVKVGPRAIVTALAADLVRSRGGTIAR
ncbi:MAG: hypothetical protein FWC46_01610 [Actinomycetia bacterium]|nr:hypothetical protein [Actinomycetes bacterium]